jgi:hypothetical protein
MIHKRWVLAKETDTHFVYRCEGCEMRITNGTPLPTPWNKECVR